MIYKYFAKRQKWRVNMDGRKDYQEYINELGQRIKLYRVMKEMSQQDLEDSKQDIRDGEEDLKESKEKFEKSKTSNEF